MASSHSQNNPLDAWRDIIIRLYPEALTKTHCVPPLHFNRVPYKKETIPNTDIDALVVQNPSQIQRKTGKRGKTQTPPSTSFAQSPAQVAFIPVPPEATPVRVQESDFRDDFGQNHVLEALGEKLQEPMFILSQVSFVNYLQKPEYDAAAVQLPRPSDLDDAQRMYSHGEADIIVLHRHYGVLIGELKSIGRHGSETSVAEKIQKAVAQLTNSKKVIEHLVSDIAPTLTVKNALFLPFVRREQVRKVLTSQLNLLKAVCQCLEASDLTEAVELCVCAEQLPNPGSCQDQMKDGLAELTTWWRHRLDTRDPLLCGSGGEELYLQIVARFVGPATTVEVHCPIPPRVEVRTAGQAVAELGNRLARLVLTRQQLEILNKDQPFVYLHGPPGTGKTVLLVLQALRWLSQGHDVHVISTRFFMLAVSYLIENSLRKIPTKSLRTGKVHVCYCELSDKTNDVGRVLDTLTKDYSKKTLCIIMDELSFGESNQAADPTQQLLQKLYDNRQENKLFIWCAGAGQNNIPIFLQTYQVDVPLRSVPRVVQEVERVLPIFHVASYRKIALPFPGLGPAPITLSHSGEGHTEKEPVDCEACGHDVAAFLRGLDVGPAESSALSWRDVFVLTRRSAGLLCDGNTQSPCSFVQGLRGAGIPVGILCHNDQNKNQWAEEVADVATARSERVTVASLTCVRGLERKVVVWLQASWFPNNEKYNEQGVRDQDTFYILSRSTTQLVIVNKQRNHPNEDAEDKPWVHFI